MAGSISVICSSKLEMEADMIFGFLDETEEWSSSSSYNSGDSYNGNSVARNLLEEEEEEEESSSCNVEENKMFWESQDKLFLANLRRSSSAEARIRKATKLALKESNSDGINCTCRRSTLVKSCRSCMLKDLSDRLSDAGFNCGICKSKWMNSKDLLSGNHTYLEVLDDSNSKKGEIRVVIELNFRAQFEMARASEEYNGLINKLPDVYVAKIERLQGLIKILCTASEKCAKDQKIHIAPWRKQKYMQAKWTGAREHQASVSSLPMERLEQLQRRRTSMLTNDFLENDMSSNQNVGIRVV